jgi:phage FluMu gp28-like protein
MDWLRDKSQIKIWEKSRRIGATYVQSFEDVLDCIEERVPAVWFSSADESAAKEYILYCSQWAKIFDKAASDVGENVIDEKNGVKSLQIVFSNGSRINALSSNPKAFRSKGGKVVWDEAAHHDQDREMWKAAKPAATWGFPIRILSTHNGKSTLFFKFIEQIKAGKLSWSLHNTDIFKAVEDGLYDKILGRKTTQAERNAWIEELKRDSFDNSTWLEEYCCIPVDEATAFLTYEQISKCEIDNAEKENLFEIEGDLFVGVDIGRRKDLTVISIVEKISDVRFLRKRIELEQAPFSVQKEILFEILSHPKLRRAAIDATGLGMQLAEETQSKFGRYRIEPITFTGKTKEEMAYNLLALFQDCLVKIPPDRNLREDLHSIRKVTTASNNIRFDVTQSEVSGHADRFWSLALALYASASLSNEPVIVTSRKPKKIKPAALDINKF